ncbi:MAG TPA: hypothetical protein VGP93_17650, partial [Polyangiaceae bacterium]|nr:hypothetical protein [Polyangiaceae bacterium]
ASGGSSGSAGTSGGNAGASGASASAGTGAGGSVATGGPPPSCSDPVTALPEGAPALTAGVWTNISPSQVPFESENIFTQGMAVDPCNPATLYLTVTGYDAEFHTLPNGGLYKSTDAGTSWTRLGPFDSGLNLRIDPSDSQHLYFGNGVRGMAGFWVSTDGGDTWTQPQGFKDVSQQKLGGDTDVYHVEPDPADFNHVLLSYHWYWDGCASGCNSGVIESFDGGESWTVHDANPEWQGAGGYDVLFLYNPALGIGDSKTWLYGSQGHGYFRTTDSGTSWKQVTTNSMEHGGATLYYTADGTLYAPGASSLMRSTDNGETWTLVGPSGGYLSVLGDGTTLYSGRHSQTGPLVVSPENDGVNWTDQDVPESLEGPFEMAFDSANGILYSASVGAGIWALKLE